MSPGKTKLIINYQYKENGDKHTVIQFAWKAADTKCFMGVDNDCE